MYKQVGKRYVSIILVFMLTLTLFIFDAHSKSPQISAETTQTLAIYPKPHNLELQDGSLVLDSVEVVYGANIDAPTKARLEKILTDHNVNFRPATAVNPSAKSIVVTLNDEKALASTLNTQAGANLAVDKYDAYTLDINEKGIAIVAATADSAYYAVTTLEQIMEQQEQNLTCLSINDYSDTRIRGFIEGYYGYPWSNENRMSLMRFGGRFKANVYIFAPKDDPYHAEHWRDLYPQEDLAKLAEMAKVGNENKCRFVWTIHPFMGKGSYKFNSNDVDGEIRAIIAKFEQLYSIGVRQFGVLGDDVGGLNRDIVIRIINGIVDWGKQKGDVKDFVFCPASYNSAWAWNPGELNDYQRGFPPNVHIFWTGSTTCAPVTADTVNTFKNRSNNGVVRRDPLFWLNWPVNDVDMTRVFMGKGEMLHTDVTNLAGVVTNPMQEAEASKVAIFAVADYAWNIAGFDADKSWQDSFSRIDPQAADALHTLAKHMSDAHPGGLRLGESEEIAGLLNKVLNEVRTGNDAGSEREQLIAELNNISVQADNFMAQSRNEVLKSELAPFVYALRDICAAGKSYLEADKLMLSEPDNKAAIWSAYAKAILLDYQAKSYRHRKINVGTVEAKPAAKRLQPFVKDLAAILNERVNKLFDFHPSSAPTNNQQIEIISEPNFGIYRGDPKSKPEHLYDDNDDTFTWFDFGSGSNYADGNYIGLDLGSKKNISKVHVVMGSTTTAADYWTKYEVKISNDKTNWESISEVFTQSSQKAVQDIVLQTPKAARYVAIFNRAYSDKWVQIGALKVSTLDTSESTAYTNITEPVLKQSLGANNAYLQLGGGQTIKLKPNDYLGLQLDNIQKIKQFSMEPQAGGNLQVEGSINGKEWLPLSESQKCKYLRLINKGQAENSIDLQKFEVNFDIIVPPFLESSSYSTIEGKNAGLDGDLTTPAWFKESQVAGKELVYNLGQTVTINNIKLYVKESEHDFARHAVIEASSDGSNWTEILTIGNQSGDNAGEDDGKIDELYPNLEVPNRYIGADGLNVTANKLRLRLTRGKSGSDKWLRFQEIVLNDGTALLPPTNYDIETAGDFRKHYYSDLSKDENLLTYTASDKGGSLIYHLADKDKKISSIEVFKSLGSYKAEIRTADGWQEVNPAATEQYFVIDCHDKEVYDLRLTWNDELLLNEVRALFKDEDDNEPTPTTEATTETTTETTSSETTETTVPEVTTTQTETTTTTTPTAKPAPTSETTSPQATTAMAKELLLTAPVTNGKLMLKVEADNELAAKDLKLVVKQYPTADACLKECAGDFAGLSSLDLQKVNKADDFYDVSLYEGDKKLKQTGLIHIYLPLKEGKKALRIYHINKSVHEYLPGNVADKVNFKLEVIDHKVYAHLTVDSLSPFFVSYAKQSTVIENNIINSKQPSVEQTAPKFKQAVAKTGEALFGNGILLLLLAGAVIVGTKKRK